MFVRDAVAVAVVVVEVVPLAIADIEP